MRLKEIRVSPPSPCPDEQQLIEFASGNLAESSHEVCAAHISHCERCHSAVEWLRQHPQRCSPEGSSEGSSVGPSVGSSNNHDEAAIDKDAASGPSDRDRIPGPSGSSPESQDGAPFVKPAANIPSRDSNPRDAKAEPQRFAEELAEWKTFLSEEQLQQGVSGKQDGSFPAVIGKLGKYEVLSVIGKGAFGTVFKAYDEQLRRMVALKLLKRSVADHPSARRRFIREARAVAAINHSNVVTIYAVEEIEGLPLLVMELVSGRTLRERGVLVKDVGKMHPLLANCLRVTVGSASLL